VLKLIRNKRGMSLMENMVAMIVFSIAIIFLYNMLFSGRMLVETGGERRMALKLAELKAEELIDAGYDAEGADDDWTSVNMTVGTHPTTETSVLIDDRGTGEATDDLIGTMTWAVRDTAWSVGGGVFAECKVVRVKVVWTQTYPRDEVVIVTMVPAE
jgi:prepilin-type N-terminal cleavage/methylation domain-containing protein